MLTVRGLIGYLLTGQHGAKTDNVSTTGMLAVTGQDYSEELLAVAGVDRGPLAPINESGERLGAVLPALPAELGIDGLPAIAVSFHNTASAVLAVPARQRVSIRSRGSHSFVPLGATDRADGGQ